MNWKSILCAIFIGVQLVLVIEARFSSNRYFVWAPHDIQVEYFLEVYANDVPLTNFELKNRYNFKNHDWIDLPPYHLTECLQEYERSNHISKTDSIYLKYSVNGHPWKTWIWNKK